MVLGDRLISSRPPREHGPQAPGSLVLAPLQRLGRELPCLGCIELDAPADRLRARARQDQLSGQPVLGDDAVGIGACDQTFRASNRKQPLAGEVHAQTPGASHPARHVHLDHVQPRMRATGVDLEHSLSRLIAATVEYNHHLVGIMIDATLIGERCQACADTLGLVSRRHHNDRLQARIGRRQGRCGRRAGLAHGSGFPAAMSSRPCS